MPIDSIGSGSASTRMRRIAEELPPPPPPPPPPPAPVVARPVVKDGFEYNARSNGLTGWKPPPPSSQKEKLAYAGLKVGERDLEASKQTVARRAGWNPEKVVDRAFQPKDANQRVAELEQRLPQLRRFKDEFEQAKAKGAPQAEVDAKLEKFSRAAAKTQGAVTGSLETENAGLESAADNLQTAANVSAVVRDTAVSTAAAISTGGGSLVVTAGVVAGGTVLKTASQESALRVEGKGRDLKGIAAATARNAAGLTGDAAGGAATNGLKTMFKAGQLGTKTYLAARAGTNIVTGATKRAADGKPVTDAKAVVADGLAGGFGALGDKLKGAGTAGYLAAQAGGGIATGASKRAAAGEKVLTVKAVLADGATGAITGAVDKKLGTKMETMRDAPRLFVGTTSGVATGSLQQVAANAATGKPLATDLPAAALGGGGRGLTGAATTPAPAPKSAGSTLPAVTNAPAGTTRSAGSDKPAESKTLTPTGKVVNPGFTATVQGQGTTSSAGNIPGARPGTTQNARKPMPPKDGGDPD